MTFSALLVLGWLGLAQDPADAPPPPPTVPAAAEAPAPPNPTAPTAEEPPPAPTVPPAAPTVPPPGAEVPPPVPTLTPTPAVPVPVPAPAGEAAPAPAGQATGQIVPPPTFEFTLGGKNESIAPGTQGDAKAEDGKAEITTEANTLKTVVTGAAGANVFLGTTSSAVYQIQVVQEFDITCSDPSVSQVVLTLESALNGIIRSKHKASATLRLASATIAPVGWTAAPLSVSYPSYSVSGAQGYKYSEPQAPSTSAPLPLGRYVIQADFQIETTAAGLLDAHSTAIFVPESEALDAWEREHDPFAGDSHDDFGFTVTLKAQPAPGYSASKKAAKGRLAAAPAAPVAR
ncbi:hypothetical protein [Singulisphaera sp. PoT]|uniref:hypothetical protein n=1 Tax=Singulisphaera sp. PoT TaxID=3411797 RepID=UPI003BF5F800